jgi:hypothetical protein
MDNPDQAPRASVFLIAATAKGTYLVMPVNSHKIAWYIKPDLCTCILPTLTNTLTITGLITSLPRLSCKNHIP